MMNLKAHVLEVQKLENAAADKAGMRFLLLDEAKLMGKERDKYINDFAVQVITDIAPEILDAAKLGRTLGEAMNG